MTLRVYVSVIMTLRMYVSVIALYCILLIPTVSFTLTTPAAESCGHSTFQILLLASTLNFSCHYS